MRNSGHVQLLYRTGDSCTLACATCFAYGAILSSDVLSATVYHVRLQAAIAVVSLTLNQDMAHLAVRMVLILK
ncbi:MAG: hypothetical protein KBI39_00850 [Firmicutes bacterium]|nr:hypothetical protein [Candidatus Fermentithermobacillaceae bacterium]